MTPKWQVDALVQVAVQDVWAVVPGALAVRAQNRKGGTIMDFLFGTDQSEQSMGASCSCTGCNGCMGTCSGCQGCQGAK